MLSLSYSETSLGHDLMAQGKAIMETQESSLSLNLKDTVHVHEMTENN